MYLLKGPVVINHADEPWNRRTVYDLTMTVAVGRNEQVVGLNETVLSLVKCQDPRRAESFPIFGGTGAITD